VPLVQRYEETASTPGGNGTTKATTGANRAYASGSEWEAAEETDLVSDGDSHVVTCGGTTDTTDYGLGGWNTGSGNGITIECTTDKHDGRSRDVSGTGYQLSGSNANGILRNTEDYVTLDGLEIKNTAQPIVVDLSTFATYTAADNLIKIKNCIIHGPSSGSSSNSVNADIADLIFNMENTIIYGGARSMDTRNCDTVTLSYVTMWRHADQLGLLADAATTTKNCYCGKASGSSEDFWTGGAAPSGSNNISSDATATTDYTSSLINKAGSSQFIVTIGSEDFRLKSGSDCEDAGTPISGITTDIIGNTRDATNPDVGASEFVSGGITHTGSATLSGSATLTALPEHQQAATAVLSGTGTLTATATLIGAGSTATLAGVGTLSAVGTLEIAAATVLSGSSSLTGIGTHEQAASAILSGASTIQATATVERGASSTLSGTGTLTATATIISAGATASLQGQGTLTANPSLEISGTSVLTGSSTLVASPLVEFAGNATLSGVGTLVANASIVAPTNQTALLAGTSSLVARVSTHLGPLIATVSVSPSLVFDTQTEPSIIAKTEVNPNG
jgi:hypothetical protein